jgi:succinate dehydrogenase/fumarate reductase flavoprotein subunit
VVRRETGPVVVVGSGAAGLAAALGAHGAGADVLVVERASAVGGTTAMSGGVVWMPAHGRDGVATAIDDSTEDALAYLGAAARGDVDAGLVAAFVSDTRRVAEEIEQRTPIEWEVLEHWPDYRGELAGAKAGGRSLWPRALRLDPKVEGRVQIAFDQPSPTVTDTTVPANDGVVLRGHVRGRALVGGLLAALDGAGVEIRTGARATGLALEDGGVVGVLVDGYLEAGRVVLASGGFQHDSGLAGEFLPGPPIAPMGTAGCAGDGLRMARTVDAILGNTSEGWWMPAMHAPGEEVEGVRHYRPLHGERAQPGAIMVDRVGRRFVDEAQNYGDVGRAMRGIGADALRGIGADALRGLGPDALRYPAAPCWLVFDAAYRRRYPVGPVEPGGPDPNWLARADDLEGLGRVTGIPSEALVASVTRFNAGAVRGEDADFGRGTFPYDRWIGDPNAPHPTLGPLCEAPFYALEVHLGCMGTRGGPRTDDRGRVMSSRRAPVAGLYAAGNAAASPFGTATAAGGATLGPALVFGFRAGEAAAGDR